MNCLERLVRALSREALPDKVPTFVEGMMDGFRRRSDEVFGNQVTDDHVLLEGGDWTWAKFYGFDAQWLHSSPVRVAPLEGIDLDELDPWDTGVPGGATRQRLAAKVDRFGRVSAAVRRGAGGISWAYQTGYLNSKERWTEWLDAGYFDHELDASWVRYWEKTYPRVVDRGVVPVPVDTIFEKVREAFNFGRLAYFLRKDLGFVERLADGAFQWGLEFVKGCCEAGFHVVTLADDAAYKGRVMLSPETWERLLLPRYRCLNEYLHKRGLLSFYHSDGFVEPYVPGLVAAGFDGVQSLEPAAGVDLGRLKREHGNDVTLIGNLDCSRLLPFGSVEEVVAATRRCLEQAMGGGGYVFSPATDLTDSCRPENVAAALETVRRHGSYN